jgi:hypothetical protein
MNRPHSVPMTPSWYGDSVGHYEGDTLVIDTVGLKVGPFSSVDQCGTPHTEALHVVEHYRLLDYEAAKEALERNAKENLRFPRGITPWDFDPNYKGKHLKPLVFGSDNRNSSCWTRGRLSCLTLLAPEQIAARNAACG